MPLRQEEAGRTLRTGRRPAIGVGRSYGAHQDLGREAGFLKVGEESGQHSAPTWVKGEL